MVKQNSLLHVANVLLEIHVNIQVMPSLNADVGKNTQQ